MNKRIALRGKKINKIQHTGFPLSHEEMKIRQQIEDKNKVKVLSITSGIPLNILQIFFPEV